MSEWITDREPVEEDADYGIPGYNGLVFATDSTGKVIICSYCWTAHHGFPWQPIMIPEAYVKPKRYTVKWLADTQCWAVMDSHYVVLRLAKLHRYLTEHREAAERIAAIYEEVMP